MTEKGRMDIPKNWSFDVVGVADHFDKHVREQLPWYDLVTRGVVHFARHYMPQGGRMIDVGASTGNVTRAVHAAIPERWCTYASVEKSPQMAAKWSGPGELWTMDALDISWDKNDPWDFVTFFLVLMFVEPTKRTQLLMTAYEHLKPGGAIVIVDRTVAQSGYVASVMWRLALAEKIFAGATWDEVVAKELSLAGSQRPLIPEMLQHFNAVEWFRFGDFAGWVIEKPEVAQFYEMERAF